VSVVIRTSVCIMNWVSYCPQMILMLNIARNRVFKTTFLTAFFSYWLVKAWVFAKSLLDYLSFCVVRNFMSFTFIQCLIMILNQNSLLGFDWRLILISRCCTVAFKMDCLVVCIVTVYLGFLNTPAKHVDTMIILSTLFRRNHRRRFLHLIKLLIYSITMRILCIFCIIESFQILVFSILVCCNNFIFI
jgi:hypothetical protein